MTLAQPELQTDQYYDTPRKIKECLALPHEYPNYDTPHVPQAVVLQDCGCPTKLAQAPRSSACPCQNVMSWAGFVLPYCRRGAGIEATGVTVQPIRLSGEGKMPVVNANGEINIYNTNLSNCNNKHKQECEFIIKNRTTCLENSKSNYENIEPVINTQPDLKQPDYANIDFTHSLEYYENSKDFLSKTGIFKNEIEKHSAELRERASDFNNEESGRVCQKCGHSKDEKADYVAVDTENQVPEKPSPGYLPMQPVHNACSKEVLFRLCSGVKSSSNPTLSASSLLDGNRKRSESEYRVPGLAMLSSPYLRRRLVDGSDKNEASVLLRKRSYSAESARYVDEESPTFPSNLTIHKCSSETGEEALVKDERASDSKINEVSSTSLQPSFSSSFTGSCIKIRRSSSVPSKTGHNRDSSSSNDSGVSTGSLIHRTAEFVEFEHAVVPTSTPMKKNSSALPPMHHQSPQQVSLHNSLPRKCKSNNPLKEITFQFQKIKMPTKSSSAEADIPSCLPKEGKEFTSLGEVSSVPCPDSRSTSSGTSDMSDYIETLSLSSHSSSDTPDSLR